VVSLVLGYLGATPLYAVLTVYVCGLFEEVFVVKMKMVFQWHGVYDPIKLEFIRQIPCVYGIAGSLRHVSEGELWPEGDIRALRETIEGEGLAFEVVSMLPVHPDILLRQGDWATYVNNYKENVSRLAREGVKCVCYSFSPNMISDFVSDDPEEERGGQCGAFAENLTEIGEKGFWSNLKCFIDEIIPTAAKLGVNMAMYLDGGSNPESEIPNLVSEDGIDRFLALRREREHGLAMRGSLEMSARNGYMKQVRKYGAMGRVHFADLGNVKIPEDIFSVESEHPSQCASIDMAHILKTFHDADFDGYVCPGSGMIFCGKLGRSARAFHDMALWAMYLSGIWETLESFDY
jgi:mannonate dehydratase